MKANGKSTLLIFVILSCVTSCSSPTPIVTSAPTVSPVSPIHIIGPTATAIPEIPTGLNPTNISEIRELAQISDGKVLAIAASKTNDLIAVQKRSGVKLFDANTLEELSYIPASRDWLSFKGKDIPLKFSPDGQFLLISFGTQISFWDVENQTYLENRIYSHIADWTITDFELTPDLNHILVKTIGGSRICEGGVNWALYDLNSNLLFDHYGCQQYSYNYYRFTDDGKVYFFFGSIMTMIRPLTVHGVDINTGVNFLSLFYDGPSEFDATAEELNQFTDGMFFDISPDGRYIASQDYDNSNNRGLVIREMTTNEIVEDVDWEPIAHNHYQVDTFETPCSWDEELEEGNLSQNYKNVWESDDKMVVSISAYHSYFVATASLQLWDTQNCELLRTVLFPSSAFALMNQDETLLAGSDNLNVFVWDVATGENILTIEGDYFQSVHNLVAFDSTGKILVTSCRGNESTHPISAPYGVYKIYLWDIVTGELLGELSNEDDLYLKEISLTPIPNIILAKSSKFISLWNIDTQELVSTFPIGQYLFSADGETIWIVPSPNLVEQYNVSSGDFLQSIAVPGEGIRGVYLNQPESILAIHVNETWGRGFTESINFYEPTTGEQLELNPWIYEYYRPLNEISYSDIEEYGLSKYFYEAHTGEIFAQNDFSMITSSWSFTSQAPFLPMRGKLMSNQSLVIFRESQSDSIWETLEFWDPIDGHLIGKVRLPYETIAVSSSPQSNFLVVIGVDGIIRVLGVK